MLRGALIGGLAGNLVEDGQYREIVIATGAIIGGLLATMQSNLVSIMVSICRFH